MCDFLRRRRNGIISHCCRYCQYCVMVSNEDSSSQRLATYVPLFFISRREGAQRCDFLAHRRDLAQTSHPPLPSGTKKRERLWPRRESLVPISSFSAVFTLLCERSLARVVGTEHDPTMRQCIGNTAPNAEPTRWTDISIPTASGAPCHRWRGRRENERPRGCWSFIQGQCASSHAHDHYKNHKTFKERTAVGVFTQVIR